jgi:hypothetical protein
MSFLEKRAMHGVGLGARWNLRVGINCVRTSYIEGREEPMEFLHKGEAAAEANSIFVRPINKRMMVVMTNHQVLRYRAS